MELKKHIYLFITFVLIVSFLGCNDNSRRIILELKNGDKISGELVGPFRVNTSLHAQPLTFQLSQLKKIELQNSSNRKVKLETHDGNNIEGYITDSSLIITTSGQSLSIKVSDIDKISIE